MLAHAGTSGGVEDKQPPLKTLVPILEALLARYDNLYVDLSWSVKDHYVDDGKADPDWVALIEQYPGRFTVVTLSGILTAFQDKWRAICLC